MCKALLGVKEMQKLKKSLSVCLAVVFGPHINNFLPLSVACVCGSASVN